MPQELSLPHLLSCLNEKDRYKGTQVYLAQVLRFNSEIYSLIDAALTQTLLQLRTTPIARLLALRFFKEILMSANFSLIDAIDENIEDHIVEVAQYNKNCKEVNRGANFFSEVHKVKNDSQTQKISSSYVLLALEIVAVMGKCYLKDVDGEQTRFVQYLQQLSNTGVAFPTDFNFFKKDEEEKFKKNYQKWLQYYRNSNPVEVKVEKQVEEVKPQPPMIVQAISTRQQALRQTAKQIPNEPEKPKSIQTKPPVVNLKQSSEISALKQKLDEKEEIILLLQSKLKEQQKKTANLQSFIKNQQSVIAKLQEEVKITKQENQIKSIMKEPLECYQIIVNPPRNTDDLIQEIDVLQEMLENITTNYQNEKIKIQNALSLLNLQNQKLKVQVQISKKVEAKRQQEIQKERQLMKEQKLIEQKVFSKVQASLLVIDEPKIGTRQMQEKEMITIKEHILQSDRKEVLKDYSSTNRKLREQLADICENELRQPSYKQTRQGSRSLKKTQSQHRLKMNQTSTSTAGFRKVNANNESKLMKTAQSFKQKEEGSKMVTIFPYLESYFPQLPQQCLNFKQHCLSIAPSNQPFFENQWVKVILVKQSIQKCYLQVYNKTNTEQKIKVISIHPSFSIEGQKIKKVPTSTVAEFELKIGTPDLNLRCPLVSVIIGSHGISLTTSVNEKIFHLPLPITLLDFFRFNKPTKRMINSSKTIKFGVNRFALASNLPNLQSCLPSLAPQFRMGQTLRTGEVYWIDSSLKLQISQWSRQISLGIQFSDDSTLSSSMGKVLLQILMYLLRD